MVRRGSTGSSPSEGLQKGPANGDLVLPAMAKIWASRGYETGTFWNRRALGGTHDASRHIRDLLNRGDSLDKPLQTDPPRFLCWHETDSLLRLERGSRATTRRGRRAVGGGQRPRAAAGRDGGPMALRARRRCDLPHRTCRSSSRRGWIWREPMSFRWSAGLYRVRIRKRLEGSRPAVMTPEAA
jgi:hypothetical protein